MNLLGQTPHRNGAAKQSALGGRLAELLAEGSLLRRRILRWAAGRAGARSGRPQCFRLRPYRSVKTTPRVDSHFGPPAIHTVAASHRRFPPSLSVSRGQVPRDRSCHRCRSECRTPRRSTLTARRSATCDRPGVRERRRGSIRTSSLRRCARAFPAIRRCNSVLRPGCSEARVTRAARAVAGATLAEGSVRARGEVETHTSPPALHGSLPQQRSLREGGSAPP